MVIMKRILSVLFLISYMKEANGCLRHDACNPQNALCFLRKCIAADLLPMNSCTTNAQCFTRGIGVGNLGRGCKEGRCYHIKMAPGSYGCVTQEQCIGQAICIRRHCVYAEPSGLRCGRCGSCPLGERCIGGLCFQPVRDFDSFTNKRKDMVEMLAETFKSAVYQQFPEYAGTLDSALQRYRCIKHSDCLFENTVCLLRHCVIAQPVASNENQCRTNWHCRCGVNDFFERSGRFCKNGYCFQLVDAFGSVGCTTHNHCPFNSLCISRHCVYAEPTNKPCFRTGFCGIGERCIQGICYQPSSLIIHPSVETVYPESPVVIIVSPRGSITTDLTDIIQDKLAANINTELPLIIPPHIIL
ncbi:hypothetical protein T09_1956 [Trichinella sp. T9]|nr:hypothetical protein T09_1956 [Trichinella sp. T9]